MLKNVKKLIIFNKYIKILHNYLNDLVLSIIA